MNQYLNKMEKCHNMFINVLMVNKDQWRLKVIIIMNFQLCSMVNKKHIPNYLNKKN